MTIEKTIKNLKKYNAWRRDNEGKHEMPNPTEIGKTIDQAIKFLKALKTLKNK